MSETCWVCGDALIEGQACVPARRVPHRLRAFEGKPVHLRCQAEWDGVVAPARPAGRVKSPAGSLAEGKRLFAEDVATMRGVSRRQARRWLLQLEMRYGVTVVGRIDGRRGPRRFTTTAALEAIGPWVHSADAVRERMEELEARVERLERSR
ncbi:MAG TPA: hypothetical protein VGL81_31800 [Polyangiaceae bacterium]|jgi:hypothetical protein